MNAITITRHGYSTWSRVFMCLGPHNAILHEGLNKEGILKEKHNLYRHKQLYTVVLTNGPKSRHDQN